MRLLVSNDDGIDAQGINVLAKRLAVLGEVITVAPDSDRSGSSHSLTLSQPVRAIQLDDTRYKVSGTPADCVHLALSGLLSPEPDIVVSGINNAANMGDDVLYSGTVSAAMEGRHCGLSAIAVSLVTRNHQGMHYDTAAKVVSMLINQLQEGALPENTVLNVNVPDRAWEDLAGIQVTRLGRRYRSEKSIRREDPHGFPVWWVGPVGDVDDNGPGTDFHAVEHGFVSITPLHADLTQHEALGKVEQWVEQSIPYHRDERTSV